MERKFQITDPDFLKIDSEENKKLITNLIKTKININEFLFFKEFEFRIKTFEVIKYEADKIYSGVLTFDYYVNKSLTKVDYTIVFEYKYINFETNFVFECNEESGDFSFAIILIVHSITMFLLDNPNIKKPKLIKFLDIAESKLNTELLLMTYNNLNQQVIQNSFRDIDTSKQNDMKFKTTAKGLEESLSKIVLPKGDGLAIQNVELNDAFRISYK